MDEDKNDYIKLYSFYKKKNIFDLLPITDIQ